MTDILLIEHPPAIRRTLSARLSLEPDLSVVGETGDVAAALDLAERLRPAVILVDAEMPNLHLADTVEQLARRAPTCSLVVLSLNPSGVARLLPAGSVTVVGKHDGIGALLAAVRGAARCG